MLKWRNSWIFFSTPRSAPTASSASQIAGKQQLSFSAAPRFITSEPYNNNSVSIRSHFAEKPGFLRKRPQSAGWLQCPRHPLLIQLVARLHRFSFLLPVCRKKERTFPCLRRAAERSLLAAAVPARWPCLRRSSWKWAAYKKLVSQPSVPAAPIITHIESSPLNPVPYGLRGQQPSFGSPWDSCESSLEMSHEYTILTWRHASQCCTKSRRQHRCILNANTQRIMRFCVYVPTWKQSTVIPISRNCWCDGSVTNAIVFIFILLEIFRKFCCWF